MTEQDKYAIVKNLIGLKVVNPEFPASKGFNNGIDAAIKMIEQSWDSDHIKTLKYPKYHTHQSVAQGENGNR